MELIRNGTHNPQQDGIPFLSSVMRIERKRLTNRAYHAVVKREKFAH
jgi:hypothetical protein